MAPLGLLRLAKELSPPLPLPLCRSANIFCHTHTYATLTHEQASTTSHICSLLLFHLDSSNNGFLNMTLLDIFLGYTGSPGFVLSALLPFHLSSGFPPQFKRLKTHSFTFLFSLSDSYFHVHSNSALYSLAASLPAINSLLSRRALRLTHGSRTVALVGTRHRRRARQTPPLSGNSDVFTHNCRLATTRDMWILPLDEQDGLYYKMPLCAVSHCCARLSRRTAPKASVGIPL